MHTTATYMAVDHNTFVADVPSSGQTINSTAGRSSEVLTLVEQLLNLYRSSKDFPSMPTVRGLK